MLLISLSSLFAVGEEYQVVKRKREYNGGGEEHNVEKGKKEEI